MGGKASRNRKNHLLVDKVDKVDKVETTDKLDNMDAAALQRSFRVNNRGRWAHCAL